jgi:uncharacterized repeat protein (TIGR04138 family)
MRIRYLINHLLLPFKKRRKEAFYCAQCTAELRAPLTGHGCPECGFPVLRSGLSSAPAVPEDAENPNEYPSRKPFVLIEQALGYPIDAFFFIGDALRSAQRKAADSKRGAGQLGARQFCVSLRDFTLDYFGDPAEARATLEDWKIHRSEDVGRILALMVEAGTVREAEVVAEREFAGLYTVEELLETVGSRQ